MPALIPVALYLFSFALLSHSLKATDPAHRQRLQLAAGLFALGSTLAHIAALFDYGATARGLDLHFFAALSLVGLGIALLCALLSLARPAMAALGLIVYPIAAGCHLVYALRGVSAASTSSLSWQIHLHAWLALLAYATLSLAALVAIMLWLQERALRRRQFASVLRAFPPLTLIEALLFQLIAAGFALLTLALLSGVVFVDNLFAQHLVHKTVLSLLAWAAFGALLFGRMRYGWRGRRAVRLTLTAMALLGLAFFGSKFVLELVLMRTA